MVRKLKVVSNVPNAGCRQGEVSKGLAQCRKAMIAAHLLTQVCNSISLYMYIYVQGLRMYVRARLS